MLRSLKIRMYLMAPVVPLCALDFAHWIANVHKTNVKPKLVILGAIWSVSLFIFHISQLESLPALQVDSRFYYLQNSGRSELFVRNPIIEFSPLCHTPRTLTLEVKANPVGPHPLSVCALNILTVSGCADASTIRRPFDCGAWFRM